MTGIGILTDTFTGVLSTPGDTNLKANCRFVYDPADPYAITLTILVGRLPSETWWLSRDLLDGGMWSAVGLGDVRVWPAQSGHEVAIGLYPPDGWGVLLVPMARLGNLIHRSLRVVPQGKEPEFLAIPATPEQVHVDKPGGAW